MSDDHPYRTPEERGEESETMKLIKQLDREMLERFAMLLSETNPHCIDEHTRKLSLLAHERRLAIQLETARVMRFGHPTTFAVVDGMLTPVKVQRQR